MSLTAYRSNRVFAKTREPVGRVRRGNRSRIFVVQKHDASRLLYDFRLAVNGVLASLGSTQRAFDEPCGQALGRKAGRPSSPICEIRGCDSAWPNTEPERWDLGKYEPLENQPLEEQLVRGKIHIVLLGEKLRGGFTLVQIERRSISFSRSDYLLLIKSRDEYADPSWDIESLRFDCSVFTGREIPGLAGAVSEWVPLMLVDAAPPIGASIREHGLEAYRKICPRRAAAVFLPIWTRVSPSRISCADVDDDQGGRDRFGY